MKQGLPELCQITPAPIEEETNPNPEKIDHLYIGKTLTGKTENIFISKKMLTKHVVILAGSGSGKTVLVRRFVEEASLLGIPSIVIDCANDLSRLGDSWPTTPKNFDSLDRQKIDQYFQNTDVMIWTPGLNKGNPLCLETLPDFSSLTDDDDELNQALKMVTAGFQHSLQKVKLRKRKNN